MSLSLIKNLARFLNPHDAFRCSQIADLVTQIYFDKQKFINLPGFLIEKCVISDFIIDFLINAQFSQKALKSLTWASFLYPVSSDPPPMTYTLSTRISIRLVVSIIRGQIARNELK